MRIRNMKKFLSALTLCLFLCPTIAKAAPAPVVPAGAEAINTHDMTMFKDKQEMQKRHKDFEIVQEKRKNDKKEKNKKTKKIIEENVTIEEVPVIKAKVEEYKTKGVYVEKVDITPSEILTEEEIYDIIETVRGQNVHFEQLQDLINKINWLYASKGFVTARAFLPAQTIENGVVKIELIEGKVGKVTVSNNRWTSGNYIKKRLQAKPGEIFDIAKLEKDILKFNRYNDGVKLKADLVPGEIEGTTDIKLETDENFPFRITGLLDNAGRHTIGEVRGGLMLGADSLFGQRDKFSIGAYKSQGSLTPYADYNIPVNKYDGRVGATFSMSNSEIIKGPYTMFDIASRSYNYALYYTHPLIRKPFFELNSYTGLNYKQATTSFDGFDLYTDKVTSAQFSLNARYDTRRGIWYASQGAYHAFPMFDKGSKYFKYEGSFIRLHDFGKEIVGQFRVNYQVVPKDVIPYVDQFQGGGIASVRGYSEGLLIGKSGYLMSGELLFPILPKNIKIWTKNKKETNMVDVSSDKDTLANTDTINAANVSIISSTAANENNPNEISIEDSGKADKKYTAKKVPFLGRYVKGVVFIDHAGVFPFKGRGPGSESINKNDFLTSMGLGFRFTLPKDIIARLYYGYPLIHNNHEAYYKSPRFHFELSITPDFDTLLKNRKRKEAI